ncbi:MAG: winged helix-turn-helix transcriptional regulator [Candidatus Peregrinibacteria bacterium]|nr:winged helix-turn-helix transcriptional regulator [Candidatus Peregrinibacteria bacterium]MCB9807831.1 winged helix-turn-helix transcriptional regulator [Candidatus Peribacteria bacterium]
MERTPINDPAMGKMLKVLGSSRAREILFRIMHNSKPVVATSLAKELCLTDAAVCQHLRKLEDAGLICRHEQKTQNGFVMIIEPQTAVLRERLLSIVSHIDTEL